MESATESAVGLLLIGTGPGYFENPAEAIRPIRRPVGRLTAIYLLLAVLWCVAAVVLVIGGR
jgi:hypothetical protein